MVVYYLLAPVIYHKKMQVSTVPVTYFFKSSYNLKIEPESIYFMIPNKKKLVFLPYSKLLDSAF